MSGKVESAQRLLLLNRVLDGRDVASGFVLILDTIDQPADLAVDDVIRRAQNRKSPTIFLSYQTMRKHVNADEFIDCANLSPDQVLVQVQEITTKKRENTDSTIGPTVIIDSLHPLTGALGLAMSLFISNLLSCASSSTSGSPSLFAVFQCSVPVIPTSSSPLGHFADPLSILFQTATSILTLHSPTHLLARIGSARRSMPEPVFGIAEGLLQSDGGIEGGGGILVSLDGRNQDGMVIEAEIRRRRSGRGQTGWYYLGRPGRSDSSPTLPGRFQHSTRRPLTARLLSDYPPYSNLVATTHRPAPPITPDPPNTADQSNHQSPKPSTAPTSSSTPTSNPEDPPLTFSLSLTDQQRQNRDAVVLPYFDAQNAHQPGQPTFDLSAVGNGGRILYDMGEEDDFDDEEDEI